MTIDTTRHVHWKNPLEEFQINTISNSSKVEKSNISRVCDCINNYLPFESLDPYLFSESLEKLAPRLKELTHLNLTESYISSFPEELTPLLSSVEEVDFDKNYQEGIDLLPIIIELLELENLKYLSLAFNYLSSEALNQIIPNLCASSLTNIDLRGNEVSESFLSNCKSKNIQVIHSDLNKKDQISKKKIEYEIILKKIQKDLRLNEINFSDCINEKDMLAEFFSNDPKLDSLMHLDFFETEISSFPPDLISHLTGVTSINLHKTCQDSKKADSLLTNLLGLPNLSEINLSHNHLSRKTLFFLINHVKNCDKKPKEINFFFCVGDQRLFEQLESECKINQVKMTRRFNYSKEELGLLKALENINKHLPGRKIPIPIKFYNSEDFFNQIEPSIALLEELKQIDLSDMTLKLFPKKLFPYLKNVERINLENAYKEEPSNLNDLRDLCFHLPQVVKINFKGNIFGWETNQSTLIEILGKMPNLKWIDLSETDINIDYDFIEFCKTKEITYKLSI